MCGSVFLASSPADATLVQDGHQVLLELLGDYRIQKGVSAGIQREEEDEEDLRLGNIDVLVACRCCEPEESDGKQA